MKHLKTTLTMILTATLAAGMVACSDDDAAGTTDGSGGSGNTDGTGGSGDGSGGKPGGTGGSGASTGGGGGAAPDCSTLAIAEEAGLTSLVAAVKAAGLESAMEGDDLTIFAPTNSAFAALLYDLGKNSLADLKAHQLVPILTYHVADGVIRSGDAVAAAAGAGSFATLGGLVAIEGNVTDGLFLDPVESNAQILLDMVDVEACNGTIVHVIDEVLLPSITDIVSTQSSFSGLKGLIAASDATTTDVADILDAASADGGYTLFAPSNTAAAAAPNLTPQEITDVLLYHAYSAAAPVYSSAAVTLNATVPMANGDDLKILGSTSPVGVKLTDEAGNDVQVDLNSLDIYAANGVIHGIPAILIPSALVP